jgi:Coenzyme PQQ synthesis protein D (PqqD)
MLRNPNKGDVDMLTEPGQQFLTRSRSVVSRAVAGETLIVPVRGKVGDLASIYSFNGTGSLIWRLLEAPRELTELIGAVEREYEVGQEQAQKDVTRFVDDMLSVGLVEICPRVAVAETEMTSINMTAAESHRQAGLETAGSH